MVDIKLKIGRLWAMKYGLRSNVRGLRSVAALYLEENLGKPLRSLRRSIDSKLAMSSQDELDNCLEAALELARRAGQIAYGAYHRDKDVQTKESTADLVTETDKKVEELIISELKQRFPTHSFIGEECSADDGGCPELTDNPTWMIDPIDGTTNFVHRFPFSAISIGLAVDKTPVVGVVYNFILDQMFAAQKGGGATMNGKPIHVSQCNELTKAVLLSEFGSTRPAYALKPKIDVLFNLAVEPNPVHGIRMIGSAALSMCMVACGSVDGYFEYGIHCWDIAAGDIIVREAGGVTLYPTGDPLDVMQRGILCAGTQDLTTQLIPHMQHLSYKKD